MRDENTEDIHELLKTTLEKGLYSGGLEYAKVVLFFAYVDIEFLRTEKTFYNPTMISRNFLINHCG